MRIVRRLRWAQVPLVGLAESGFGGFMMSPVHGVCGAEERARHADGHVDDTTPFNRKQVIQQIFDAACNASIDVRQMVPNGANAYTHCLVGVA